MNLQYTFYLSGGEKKRKNKNVLQFTIWKAALLQFHVAIVLLFQSNLLPNVAKKHAKPQSPSHGPLPGRLQNPPEKQQDQAGEHLQRNALGPRQGSRTRSRGEAEIHAGRHHVAAVWMAAASVLQQAGHPPSPRHPDQPQNHGQHLRPDDALHPHVTLPRLHSRLSGLLPSADLQVGSVFANSEGRHDHRPQRRDHRPQRHDHRPQRRDHRPQASGPSSQGKASAHPGFLAPPRMLQFTFSCLVAQSCPALVTAWTVAH